MHISEIEKRLQEIDNGYLSNHEKIVDLHKLKESHIAFLKANPRNKRFMPYYERLKKLVS